MGTRTEDVNSVMAALERALEHLPSETVAVLAERPDTVSVALASAAGVLARTREHAGWNDGPESELVGEAEARERLGRRTRSVIVDDTLGSDEVAALLGLKGRASVLKRLRAGRLIGIEGERRGVRFPRAQFSPEGGVWPGVDEVGALFPDGFSAWYWLTAPSGSFGGQTPIDRLRAGEVDRVVAAARGERQGDFT